MLNGRHFFLGEQDQGGLGGMDSIGKTADPRCGNGRVERSEGQTTEAEYGHEGKTP